jgi:hypothetical protein
VVVSAGAFRRGQADFFIGRGQERKRLRRCSGWRVAGGADKNAFLQDPLLLLNKAIVNGVVSDPKPN